MRRAALIRSDVVKRAQLLRGGGGGEWQGPKDPKDRSIIPRGNKNKTNPTKGLAVSRPILMVRSRALRSNPGGVRPRKPRTPRFRIRPIQEEPSGSQGGARHVTEGGVRGALLSQNKGVLGPLAPTGRFALERNGAKSCWAKSSWRMGSGVSRE